MGGEDLWIPYKKPREIPPAWPDGTDHIHIPPVIENILQQNQQGMRRNWRHACMKI